MKVAIVCGAPSSEHLAPQTEDWEVWCLGNRIDRQKGKRVTRIFEIHDDLSSKDPKYPKWLADIGLPMVVGEKFPVKGKHITVFPFDEAEKLFGCTYLTSSPAYMIALALLEGAKEIALYGCDMAVDDAEYFWQRPCVEAWVGFAKGRGVKVTIPDVSPVLKSHYVEGRDYDPEKSIAPFSQVDFEEVAAMHQAAMDAQDEAIEKARAIKYTNHGAFQVTKDEKYQKVMEEQDHAIEVAIAKKYVHQGARDAYQRMVKVSRAVEGGQKITRLSDTLVLK